MRKPHLIRSNVPKEKPTMTDQEAQARKTELINLTNAFTTANNAADEGRIAASIVQKIEGLNLDLGAISRDVKRQCSVANGMKLSSIHQIISGQEDVASAKTSRALRTVFVGLVRQRLGITEDGVDSVAPVQPSPTAFHATP